MKKQFVLLSLVFAASPVIADTGIYTDFLVGSTDIKAKVSNISSTLDGEPLGDIVEQTDTEDFTTDFNSSTSYGLRAGYQFNSYIAVELGYQRYGEFKTFDEETKELDGKIKVNSINFGIKGILPLSDKINLNARLGLAKWDVKIEDILQTGEPMLKPDGTDLYYGIGADYKVNETVSIGLEYSLVEMKWDQLSTTDIDGLGVLSFSNDIDFDVNSLSLAITVKY